MVDDLTSRERLVYLVITSDEDRYATRGAWVRRDYADAVLADPRCSHYYVMTPDNNPVQTPWAM